MVTIFPSESPFHIICCCLSVANHLETLERIDEIETFTAVFATQ